MLSLLVKLFIKNPDNTQDSLTREKYGILTGILGIFLNLLLFFSKLLAGLFTKSIAIIADALNNLSDAGSSLLTIIGFKIANKKADAEHPFGHGRFEYITGLIVSCLIIVMGFELFRSSIDAIISPSPLKNMTLFSVLILITSIIVKLYMYIYNHTTAKKISSSAMEATAKDSLSDTISTIIVLFSLILTKIANIQIDGYAGLFVSLFILYSGFSAAKETIEPLLGTAPSKKFTDEIEKTVLAYKPVMGVHDLVVHDYGPGRKFISLHAEVPGNGNFFEIHDVIDNAEFELSHKFNCDAVIHMDPIDSTNKKVNELKQLALNEAKKIDSNFTVHDFRIVPGKTHINIIFDVVKPRSCKLSDNIIIKTIVEGVHKTNPTWHCKITVDNCFI